MSGGPPHHPRQTPSANTAWNHLQVPNYYPTRQPQHAHMSNEHPLLHQPTWHTPTTEPMKPIPTSHLYNLEQMLNERQYPRHSPGVDLSLTRNGSQANGDLSSAPISLSVRDTNKINSLPVSALDIQAVELTKAASPGLKSLSPGLKPASPGLKSGSPIVKPMSPGMSTSPGLSDKPQGSPKNTKRSNIRVDSILERLNSQEKPSLFQDKLGIQEKSLSIHEKLLIPQEKHIEKPHELPDKLSVIPMEILQENLSKVPERVANVTEKISTVSSDSQKIEATSLAVDKISKIGAVQEQKSGLQEKIPAHSVIVQPASSSHDENSNSSGILNVPTPTNMREDDALSAYSNEDSSDGNKSRRKRKPSKTVRMTKDEEKLHDEVETQKLQGQFSIISQQNFAIPEEAEVKTSEGVRHQTQSVDNSAVTVTETDPLSSHGPIQETSQKASEPVDTPDGTENKSGSENLGEILEGNKIPERRRSASTDEPLENIIPPRKTRRKTSSESETIANIAAMVQEGLDTKKDPEIEEGSLESELQQLESGRPVSVSVIKQPNEEVKETVVSVQNQEPKLSATVNINQPSLSTPVIQTAAQRKATNFVEVENKLEEMFAGIDETLSDPLQTDLTDGTGEDFISDSINNTSDMFADSIPSSSQNQDVTSTSNDITPKKPASAKKAKGKSVKAGSRRSSDSLESTPKKKKSSKKSKKAVGAKLKTPVSAKKGKKPLNGKQMGLKNESILKDVYAYDSGSNTSSTKSKGPFIQIKGPRDSPISVSIVNTPTNEEDHDRKPSKAKKFHDDTEYRHKVRSKGLHCSTLSNKYDAQTRDVSWICVFCKLGPHCSNMVIAGPFGNQPVSLGDLFGPYIIGTESLEFEKRLEDPYDSQFKSKKAARAAEVVMNIKITGKKSKRKHSESERSDSAADAYLGITETGDKTYEIWVHEDCIVWSPGVYLVGPKIVGLEEAVWTACNVKCVKCNHKGANVCCLRRGCVSVTHISCARVSDWQLDEVNYKAFCPQHKTV